MKASLLTESLTPYVVLPLGSRTYRVPYPGADGDAGRWAILLALIAQFEVKVGWSKKPLPASIEEMIEGLDADRDYVLTDAVYEQMVADGLHPTAISRARTYALLVMTKGTETAELFLLALQRGDEPPADPEDDGLPKASKTSGRSTGRGSGSARRTSGGSSPRTTSRSGSTKSDSETK